MKNPNEHSESGAPGAQMPRELLLHAKFCAPSRIKYYVGVFGLLFGLFFSGRAAAQANDRSAASHPLSNQSSNPASNPKEAAHTRNAPGRPEEDDSHYFGYILLGSSILLGFGIFGVLAAIRRRHERRLFDFEKVHYDDENFTDRVNAEHILGPPRSIIRQVSVAPDEPSTLEDILLARQNIGEAEQSSVQSPLEQLVRATGALQAPKPSSRRDLSKMRTRLGAADKDDDDQLARMVCSGCERRYAMGAQFCYHDGLPLTRDSAYLAERAPSFSACKGCGWEADTALAADHECPQEADMVELDAAHPATVIPMLPLMICPGCAKISPPGLTQCPVDGHQLHPLTNMRAPEFPLHGFGPRRKICTKCGAQHGPSARFCSLDGTRLTIMN